MKDQVIAILEEAEITGFQVTDRVIARSIKGAPRYDTPVWPGYNVIFTIQTDNDEKAASLTEKLRAFNSEAAGTDDELLTVCSWNMENHFIG
jgi:hypothetical protein